MSRRTILLGFVVVAAIASIWLWRLATLDPMRSFSDFPWTYITEAAVGSDDSRVIVLRGSITSQSQTQTSGGETAWPAYVHPDPQVVPAIDGKPCIIPLIQHGNSVSTPVIRSLGRPLNQHEIDGLVRYLTPEGRERMDAFRKEMGQ